MSGNSNIIWPKDYITSKNNCFQFVNGRDDYVDNNMDNNL